MPQPEISKSATIIQFLVTGLFFCLAFINALSFFVLRGIKKNSDNLWSKLNENRKRCDDDHDSITEIKSKCNIKNGGS